MIISEKQIWAMMEAIRAVINHDMGVNWNMEECMMINELSKNELELLIKTLNVYCLDNTELKDCLKPLFDKINNMIDNHWNKEAKKFLVNIMNQQSEALPEITND